MIRASVLGYLLAFSSACMIPNVPYFNYEDFKCLVLNGYHEARGEGPDGLEAVTQVVLNRASKENETACNVIYKPYQFSWTTKKANMRGDPAALPGFGAISTQLWARLVHGEVLVKSAGGRHARGVVRQLESPIYLATHYHATHVRPTWAKRMQRVGKIGNHIFYKEQQK